MACAPWWMEAAYLAEMAAKAEGNLRLFRWDFALLTLRARHCKVGGRS